MDPKGDMGTNKHLGKATQKKCRKQAPKGNGNGHVRGPKPQLVHDGTTSGQTVV